MKILILILVSIALATETWALNLVVPNTNALAEGDNANAYPLSDGTLALRYQQIYDASQFGLLWPDGGTISSVGFRCHGHWNDRTIKYSITIYLSTTTRAVDGLNSNFTNNIGSDKVRVFSGSYTLNPVVQAANPWPFSVVIPFQSAFFYNPTNGNLLLDLQITESETTPWTAPFVDQVGVLGDSVSRAHKDPTDSFTYLDTIGAVTEFGITPIVTPKPQIKTVAFSGNNLMVTGSGGASGLVYCVLTSTNLSQSMTNWFPVSTNAFDTAGNFIFTNGVDSTLPQQFFRLQIQ
jgi:hypothetical protein